MGSPSYVLAGGVSARNIPRSPTDSSGYRHRDASVSRRRRHGILAAVRPGLIAVLVGLAASAACYNPSVDPCRISCAADSPCPGELACGADLRCHVAGDTTACGLDGDGGIDADVRPAGAFKAMAVGDEFVCAIGAADDELYCWGTNFVGQLGDGTLSARATPGIVDEPGPWQAVGAGPYHVCAIKVTGAMFCWGGNDTGEIGAPASGAERAPRRVTHPTGAGWIAVDGGEDHTCAVDADGALLCWGGDTFGQLGTGAGAGVHPPAPIPGGASWAAVAASDYATCARRTDGAGFCWGQGAIGQAVGIQSDAPVEIAGGHSFRTLGVNRSHGCGVTTGGALLCWGEDQLGELGDAFGPTPSAAQAGADFVDVFVGRWVTCATRTSTDELLCFGDNRDGQLGRGDRTTSAEVTLALPARVIAADTGHFFTCALDQGGTISCFGRDDHGQCGDGVIDDRFLDTATPVAGFGTATIGALSGRFWHTCAISDGVDAGRLWCWGDNSEGQLGTGDLIDRATPVEVPQQGGPWIAVSTGAVHTCALVDLTPNSAVYCWGSNESGQLGDGSFNDARSPVAVSASANFVALGGGGGTTCAIDSNAERWCWGNNTQRELGDGSSVTSRPTPVEIVNGASSWLRIDGGFGYLCGQSATGELWCWGSNENGRLGIGPTPSVADVPTRVGTDADWRTFSTDAQSGTTCGIRSAAGSNGDLYCWGNNDNYQLGTGLQQPENTPTAVGTGRLWQRVDSGAQFTCALDDSANLFCWGSNGSLQIAPGPDRDHVGTIPATTIWANAGLDQIETGYEHACALLEGQVYCWGDGSYGQLGDGNRATRMPRPVIAPP